MTLVATIVGVVAFANNGPRTENVCWGLNASKLQLGGVPRPIPVHIVGAEVCTSITAVPRGTNSDGRLLKLKRVGTPDKACPLTREDRSRTRSAVIKVPDDNMAFGFRRTSTCCPTIRSAGTLTLKRNPVVSIGVPSA